MQQENFSTGKERKKLLADNKKRILTFKEKAAEKIKMDGHYTWLDSDSDRKIKDQFTMSASFKDVIPNETKSLKEYIRETLRERRGKAIGVEFGGPGRQLFHGIGPNFFKKSFGITLVDLEKKSRDHFDDVTHHTVIEGNILSDKLYEKLEKLLGEEKVDLIIERIGKGMEFIPPEPYTLSKILQRWYSMLREGGIMFVQTPVALNTLLNKWGELITEKYSDCLEFQYTDKGEIDGAAKIASSIRLRKLKNAPNELPFLDPRTISKTQKNYYGE